MHKIVHKHDIVEYQDFLTKEECQELINYFNIAKDDWMDTCFYASYVMDTNSPKKYSNNKKFNDEYFDNLKFKLRTIAQNIVGKELKSLSMSAHKWTKGAYALDHSDNSELDGTLNAWQDNKFVTILYLNDNYSGGNLTFDAHDISISPKTGTVVAFDPSFHNLHGVTKITDGVRYTILFSYDHADATYERDLHEWRKEYMPIQEKQREEWKKTY